MITPRESVSAQTALNNACMRLLNYNCGINTNTIAIDSFDADKDGTIGDIGSWTWGTSNCGGAVSDNGDNLAALCYCYYQVSGTATIAENACKKLCQC